MGSTWILNRVEITVLLCWNDRLWVQWPQPRSRLGLATEPLAGPLMGGVWGAGLGYSCGGQTEARDCRKGVRGLGPDPPAVAHNDRALMHPLQLWGHRFLFIFSPLGACLRPLAQSGKTKGPLANLSVHLLRPNF